jgi:4-coumarate--CoA ligase
VSFTSPHRDVDIPNATLYEFLFTGSDAHHLDRPALVDARSGSITTYRSLAAEVNAIAGALAARGLQPGEVVGLLAVNSPAFAAVYHGVLRAGGVVTTVNALYTADDVARQLADAGARFLFADTGLQLQATAAAGSAGIPVDHIFAMDADDRMPSVGDLVAEEAPPVRLPLPADASSQLAVLPYSSGTTGRPKGVKLTHRNMIANLCQIERVMGITAQDTLIATLPFFHVYGMTTILNAGLHHRARIVTMPKFELRAFLAAISTHRCTYAFIAPPIAVSLAKDPMVNEFDLSSLDTIVSGAAPLDRDLALALQNRLRCRVRQGYGMSEMSPVSHAIPRDRDDIDLGSVGTAVPNMECKLVDPATGTEIPLPTQGRSTPGELWCKGPNVMAGYLGDDRATAATLDADGYLHTGDIAIVDDAGVVTIVDRIKELIKYKGYQVPPAELEALLRTHPQILDVAVVAARTCDGEEVPKAYVVPTSGSALDSAAVMTFVADRVSPHKKIRLVEFIDNIPKTPTGKILRRELVARGETNGTTAPTEAAGSEQF